MNIQNRGERLKDDEFHIVVNSWVKNEDNKFLITQRVATKSFPLMLETKCIFLRCHL